MRSKGNEEMNEGPHPKVKGYTGPYRYKDKGQDKIDTVTMYMLRDMKTFKGAKDVSTEWLTKENPVRQQTNPDYYPHKGQEDI